MPNENLSEFVGIRMSKRTRAKLTKEMQENGFTSLSNYIRFVLEKRRRRKGEFYQDFETDTKQILAEVAKGFNNIKPDVSALYKEVKSLKENKTQLNDKQLISIDRKMDNVIGVMNDIYELAKDNIDN